MAKGIQHYSKVLRREANDGPTTRHVVVEKLLVLFIWSFPKSDQ
jgi:hypothetical protein